MAQVEAEKNVQMEAYRTYICVWVALLVLLAATIAVAKIGFTGYSVFVNLLIASIKAGLVLFFFMHLKDEGCLVKAMLFIVIFTLTAVIALFFADVLLR